MSDPTALREIVHQLNKLAANLRRMSDRDPDQEVGSFALPVLDAALSSARAWIPPGHRVADAVQDVISPETIAQGETIRAVDVLLVTDLLVGVLSEQLPKPPPRAPRWVRERYK